MSENVSQAAEAIRQGLLVAFPTETVYGLGANAFDPIAVARIFEAKARPHFDPLIVHLSALEEVANVAEPLPEAAQRLAARFWPGPLTLVLPKKPVIPDIVTAGLPTVAVRVPNHPLALALLRSAKVPIAAPSANRFGGLSPTRAEDVRAQLGDVVAEVIDGGPCAVGLESTIVSFVADRPMLLRPGGAPVEDIEAIIGPLHVPKDDEHRSASPGRQLRHYAPRTPITLDLGEARAHEKIGLLTFHPPAGSGAFEVVEVLSPQGDLREAAANLFAALRRLDAAGLDIIFAAPVPEHGLGRAIMDRLRRAARR